jgi:dynein intermediate chain 2
VLKFQDERMVAGHLPTNSYLWDVLYPNHPMLEMCSPSPVVCMRHNIKTPDILCAGCYNGQVGIFDTRKPRASAIQSSAIDHSHHDPVYDVFWVQSKTNNQFVSVSTDGQMLWWDTRKLSEPTDVIQLVDGAGRVLGGSSMEYNIEAGPAKYLVGSEQGVVLSLNMRKRGGGGKDGKDAGGASGMVTAMDAGPGKHHGPIYSIQRNPFHPTSFLTVGDWTCRMWNEKNKGPILMTPYSKAYLTSGCWSPTRPGVFYTCRSDGVLDCWDYNYRQTQVAYSHKVSEYALSCIAVQGSAQNGGGRLVAVGDVNGTVSLLEVSDSLAVPQPNEKVTIGMLFDRESKREENLEKKAQLMARLARQASNKNNGEGGAAGPAVVNSPTENIPMGQDLGSLLPISPEAEEALKRVDAEFMDIVRGAEEEESKSASKPAAENAPAAE